MMTLYQALPGQAVNDIRLNAPDMDRGLTIMKALGKRASTTSFSPAELSLQDLSDLLWAANGVNRPESGKRTAPSSVNAQDIDIYVLMASGAWRYDAAGLVTRPRVSMDSDGLRKLLSLTAKQHIMMNNPVGYPAE